MPTGKEVPGMRKEMLPSAVRGRPRTLWVLMTSLLLSLGSLTPNTASAAGGKLFAALSPIPADYLQSAECKATTLRNAPPPGDQGPIEFCSAVAAQWLYKQYLCRTDVPQDCLKLPDKTTFPNLFFIESWSHTHNADSIRFNIFGDSQGLNPYVVINRINVDSNGAFVPENCFSYDDLLTRYGHNYNAVANAFLAVESELDKLKSTSGTPCSLCLSELVSARLGIYISPTYLAGELKYYSKDVDAMNKIIFTGGECNTTQDKHNESVYEFPDDPYYDSTTDKKPSYNEFMNKLSSLLRRNIGVASTVCLTTSVDNAINCLDDGVSYSHGLNISGICIFCDKYGADCRDALHIVNTWGDAWQQLNHDGWVDAKIFYDHTYKQRAMLIWLSDAN
jgi:hypothetical protein